MFGRQSFVNKLSPRDVAGPGAPFVPSGACKATQFDTWKFVNRPAAVGTGSAVAIANAVPLRGRSEFNAFLISRSPHRCQAVDSTAWSLQNFRYLGPSCVGRQLARYKSESTTACLGKSGFTDFCKTGLTDGDPYSCLGVRRHGQNPCHSVISKYWLIPT